MAEREGAEPGSGTIVVPGPIGPDTGGIDGWGLYAEDPVALVAEVRRLAASPQLVY